MICPENKYSKRILRVLLATAVIVVGSCGGDGDRTEQTPFSEDESYLIEAYIQIKHAGSKYRYQQAVAESLFTRLDSTIDSVRIANTIRTINQTPERWGAIFQKIEDNLRAEAEKKKLEESGGGS